MNLADFYKPYDPNIRGDLVKYLLDYDGSNADNMFQGPEYFFIIRDRGFLIPNTTFLRVSQSPIPDVGYSVNKDLLLESNGPGDYNMSLMWAKKGVYDPACALKNAIWSIFHLRLSE